MKHILYEHPVTHSFAMIRLPHGFLDGDTVVAPPDAQWFGTREDALATLPTLFDLEDGQPDTPDDPIQGGSASC